jgi:multimeric flavodoxin WrbA
MLMRSSSVADALGNMCAQMRNFLDQTSGLWMSATGRQGGQRVTSTASQHGGQETITSPTSPDHEALLRYRVGPYSGDPASNLIQLG